MNDFKETLSLAEEIYYNPELGFKEFKTSKLIENFIKKYFPQEKITKFSETGIKFNLGEKNLYILHLLLKWMLYIHHHTFMLTKKLVQPTTAVIIHKLQ